MIITSLVENTAKEGFSAEHGLSLYIETDEHKILFDMGQSDMFLDNAKKLGIDLAAVDFAVVSHGHYDHGGGLGTFLRINKKAPVYISKYAFEPHYNGSERYIGLDASLKNCDRLVFIDGIFEITKGITLYSCNEKEKKYNLGSFGLTVFEKGEYLPDDFRHEQYMIIEENGKRILFSGCSHKGILDIAEWFLPDVLVGGFHFSKLNLDDTLAMYAQTLDKHDAEFYTCHCTGYVQFEYMQKYMRKLHYISSGESVFTD